ncbi:hypothetical protein GCM10027194_36810 [Thalassiella azotivora]
MSVASAVVLTTGELAVAEPPRPAAAQKPVRVVDLPVASSTPAPGAAGQGGVLAAGGLGEQPSVAQAPPAETAFSRGRSQLAERGEFFCRASGFVAGLLCQS